jgi:hypothetical protein
MCSMGREGDVYRIARVHQHRIQLSIYPSRQPRHWHRTSLTKAVNADWNLNEQPKDLREILLEQRLPICPLKTLDTCSSCSSSPLIDVTCVGTYNMYNI